MVSLASTFHPRHVDRTARQFAKLRHAIAEISGLGYTPHFHRVELGTDDARSILRRDQGCIKLQALYRKRLFWSPDTRGRELVANDSIQMESPVT